MTNEELKRAIEKATGDKLNCWIRHDGNNWYEGGAKAGAFNADLWNFYYSRREARHGILTKLYTKITETK